MIQWLRLCIPSAGGLSSIPSQGTKPRMLQLKDPGTSKLEKKKKKEQEGNPSHEFPGTSLALLGLSNLMEFIMAASEYLIFL